MKQKNLNSASRLKLHATMLFLALCPVLFVQGQQVIYVDASNNSGNEDGTEAHPFNTIKEGINTATPGYKVMIKQGTYIPDDTWSGNPHTLLLKAGVSLIGEGADKTIIQGIVVDQENSNLSIGLEKLKFDEIYFARGSHPGPFTEPNIIRDCSTDYIDLAFGAGFPVNDTTPGPNYGFLIENNDLGTEGIIDFKQGAGVSNLTVQNNTCGYIYLKSGGGYTYLIDNNDIQYGIFDASGANITTISNNRIYNGGIDDSSGGNQYGNEDQIIENNTITADENSPAFAEEDYKAAITAKSRSVTVRNNIITCTGHVSGIRSSAGAPMHLIDNTITLDEVQTPDPDPYEGTSGIFNYSGWGYVSGNKITGGNMGYYSKAGTVEFSNNEIDKSFTGFFSMGAEEVHHNTIKNCIDDGMILDGLRGPVFANTVKNNGGTGILVLRAPIDLGGGADTCPGLNMITGNGSYDLYILATASSNPVIYARYNVWDHSDTLEVMQYDIHDGDDSTGCARVDFTPCSALGFVDRVISEVVIYPNPVESVLHLRHNISGSAGIEILDLSGRMVLKLFEGEFSSYKMEFNVSQLSSGIYFLQISSDNIRKVTKLIKD